MVGKADVAFTASSSVSRLHPNRDLVNDSIHGSSKQKSQTLRLLRLPWLVDGRFGIRLIGLRNNVNRSIGPKLDDSFSKRKKRIVRSSTDKKSGFKPGPSLPDNNLSAPHPLAPKNFHTEPLGLGIATVLCAALTFDVSHLSLKVYLLHPKFGERAAVAVLPSIIFPAPHLKNHFFRPPKLFQKLAGDRGTLDERSSHLQGLSLLHGQHLFKNDFLGGFLEPKSFDIKDLIRLHPELFSCCFDNGKTFGFHNSMRGSSLL